MSHLVRTISNYLPVLNCYTKIPASAELIRQEQSECCGLPPSPTGNGGKLKQFAAGADGTPVALPGRESRWTTVVKRRLETKNDESRFGLTRAPFFKRRGSLERGQSLARHRAAQSGIETRVL